MMNLDLATKKTVARKADSSPILKEISLMDSLEMSIQNLDAKHFNFKYVVREYSSCYSTSIY
jgi:hypothetical protein